MRALRLTFVLTLAAVSAALPPCVLAGTPADEEVLLDLLNTERTERGLPPLTWNRTLAQLAHGHAMDSRRSGVASHQSSADGAGYADRLARTDLVVRAWAENVALAGNLLEAHLGLMRSDGHRRNVLDPQLTDVGIGVAWTSDGQTVYAVQDFATVVHPLDDEAAAEAVLTALDAVPRRGWPGELVESLELSVEARLLADEMADGDRVQPPRTPRVTHELAYYYSTLDPSELPEMVADAAPDARELGVGTTFRRTAGHPTGTHWVVVLLRDIR